MSYKPDEKDWMAYLYGEMDDNERRRFDNYLLSDPEAPVRMRQFQEMRTVLAQVEDKEVIAPPLFIGDQPATPGHPAWWQATWFRAVTTIAASLLVVILVGKMTDMHIAVSSGEVRLAFGEQEAPKPAPSVVSEPALSAEVVQQMINSSLEKNNAVVRESLEATQDKLNTSIRSTLAMNSTRIDNLVREASTASQEQIRLYVEGIRTENMQQVKDYLQLTSTEQKDYIENLLVDFAKYLQQQRDNDLQLVQTRMSSLEQNTDLFKQETEQILSSIITTVGSPTSDEIRN